MRRSFEGGAQSGATLKRVNTVVQSMEKCEFFLQFLFYSYMSIFFCNEAKKIHGDPIIKAEMLLLCKALSSNNEQV